MARESLATRLYRGEVSYDFLGKRRRWYAISGLFIVISIASILFRGLHPSIDFKGGDVFQFPTNGHSLQDARDVFTKAGVNVEVSQTVQGVKGGSQFRIETKALPASVNDPKGDVVDVKVIPAIEKAFGVTEKQISFQGVGSTWGSQITHKAVTGLIVFLIAVIIYLSIRFEWKMALGAIIALLHDLVITAGIYSLVGFEVSPSTVIALLTILGYSLYDTVVVFDKVRENTMGLAGGSRSTYTQAANLAVNQTLVRSINTSIIALLPVAGLLIIGAGLLGAGSLKDLALALLIGLASGAYSSIFIATPLVAEFKEREPTYQQLARRVAARQQKDTGAAAAKSAAPTWGGRQPAAGTATTAVLDDESGVVPDEMDQPAAPPRPAGQAPRPGSRPQQQRRSNKGGRGGRPGARKKRRR
jgi:preprotein translocase subunit SecF